MVTRGRGGLGERDVDAPTFIDTDCCLKSVILVSLFRVLGGRGRLGEVVLFVVDLYTPKNGTVF